MTNVFYESDGVFSFCGNSASLFAVSRSLLTSKYVSLSLYFRLTSRLNLLDSIRTKISEFFEQNSVSLVEHDDPLHLSSSRCFMYRRDYDFYDEVLSSQETICNHYMALLDINNQIDHRDEFHREAVEMLARFPDDFLKEMFGIFYKSSLPQEVTDSMTKAMVSKRMALYRSRLFSAMRGYHAQGWYFIFDTLTISDLRKRAFYEDKTAIRDYTRAIGRKVLEAEGRSKKDSYDDCYKYFCVPEYGSKTRRLHFHVLSMCRTLPKNSYDPNYGSVFPFRRLLESFRGIWPYGFQKPLIVRYSGDAFTRAGYRWPVDKVTEKPIQQKPWKSVAFYITKYVTKASDYSACLKTGLPDKVKVPPFFSRIFYDSHLSVSEQEVDLFCLYQRKSKLQELSCLTKRIFKVSYSRKLGEKFILDLILPSLPELTNQDLVNLLRVHHSITQISLLLKIVVKKILLKRMSTLSLKDTLSQLPILPKFHLQLAEFYRGTKTTWNPSNMKTMKSVFTDMFKHFHLLFSDKLDPEFFFGKSKFSFLFHSFFDFSSNTVEYVK